MARRWVPRYRWLALPLVLSLTTAVPARAAPQPTDTQMWAAFCAGAWEVVAPVLAKPPPSLIDRNGHTVAAPPDSATARFDRALRDAHQSSTRDIEQLRWRL